MRRCAALASYIVLSVAVFTMSACTGASVTLPLGLREGVLQALVNSGDLYRSYEINWSVTNIGDLQAAAPMAGNEILAGTANVRSVYVAEIHGSFRNSLCVQGHGASCWGAYLFVALPIASGAAGYAEVMQVTSASRVK